jgi:hypothetical protein
VIIYFLILRLNYLFIYKIWIFVQDKRKIISSNWLNIHVNIFNNEFTMKLISEKRYGCKWTWETILHYTWTQVKIKEQCFYCCSTFHCHRATMTSLYNHTITAKKVPPHNLEFFYTIYKERKLHISNHWNPMFLKIVFLVTCCCREN